jgi:3-deoxy-D-manno-octulosonic-acid transferase
MNIIYNIFITLYGFAVSIASKFNPKANLWISGRKGWAKKMKQAIAPTDRVIWVHCSSLGEFEQGRPVMEKIRQEFPHHKLAVSFFSPSGYEIRKNDPIADYIFYLPLDTPKNAKKLIKNLHPEVLILVKYEYWYNLIKRLTKKKIPIIVISAVIKEKNLFFRSWGSWFRKQIQHINHFFVQDLDSKNLLNSIQIEQVTISGDTRFDRVKEIRESNPKVDFVEKFKGNSKLIVAGSTWKDDEEILLKFINEKLPEDWKIIIAPHNIDSKQIKSFANQLNKKVAIYTESKEKEMENAQVLMLDTIGILTKVYAYSDISYVGGGFTKTGVHNTLEPAVFGVPIIFGPNYENYFEAIDLIDSQAAVRFKDYYDFEPKMMELMENCELRTTRGNAGSEYIESKPNSTELIMNYLKKLIKN